MTINPLVMLVKGFFLILITSLSVGETPLLKAVDPLYMFMSLIFVWSGLVFFIWWRAISHENAIWKESKRRLKTTEE
jgi:hypothetical protein